VLRLRFDGEAMATARCGKIQSLSIAAFLLLLPVAVGAAPFAYVPNSGDGTLSVIDTATNTVTATVPVAGFGVAVNRTGTRVYLTTADGLAVLDASDNSVITVISGTGLGGVAVNQAETRVYAVAGDNSIAVIDATTNTIVTNVQVASPPLQGAFGLALSPEGATLYVTIRHDDRERRPCFGALFFCGGQVSAIDAVNYTAAPGGAGGPFIDGSLAGIVVDSTGRVWFTALSPDVVELGELEVAVFGNGVIGTGVIVATPFALAVSPDGKRLYSAPLNSASVAVIDAATRTLVASIDVSDGGGGAGVSVTPDGSRVYALASHSVAVIDAATNTVLEHIPVGNGPVAFGQFIGPAVIGASPSPTPTSSATPTFTPVPPTPTTTPTASPRSTASPTPAPAQSAEGDGCTFASPYGAWQQLLLLPVLAILCLRRSRIRR
jgi:YVTN family beta-propeller protein